MKLIPLPAFQDGSLWFVHDGHRALGVDPGDAQPVMASLQREGLELGAILVTHHPADRIDRMAASLEKLAAPAGETRVCCTDEYTLSDPRFALGVEPGNLELIHSAKRCEDPRSRVPAVRQAARGHDTSTPPDSVGVFATLRH